ncbi:conjugative transposon protein TraJ [Alistipes senegalensis]|uniref:conjugative transposon protein TraJ n=1 Tax=Alistipes senegalensis TaxID=1288121 RepID=UPI0018A91652|nr:conjugative transposon protein TraJ [Alistipes senegalensis]
MTPLAVDFDNLHQILRNLYMEMMPLCADMTGIAKGIAGLGALFYVAYRVWHSLATAEPVDVYPLLRPFALGFCILFFPTFVLGTINTVLSPIVRGTNQILQSQTLDMESLREERNRIEDEAMRRNPETAYLVDKEAFDERLEELGVFDALEVCGMYIDRALYTMKRSVQQGFQHLLELMFEAAALVIDTIRTFFLVVLSILGPIAFAFAVWDGFHATLTQWIMRYITIYLWLPVSDLFSSVLARIQVLMIRQDIEQLSDPSFIPDGSSPVYIIFLIIGILGYFTIPTVASWIVQAGGGAGNYGRVVNTAAVKTGTVAAGAAGAVAGNILGRSRKLMDRHEK